MTGSHGGFVIVFTDGTTNWNLKDQDGYFANDDGTQTTTHVRRFDLSSFAGKTVQAFAFNQEIDTAAGSFAIIYEQAAMVSADGKVVPIYTGEATAPVASISTTSGITGAGTHIDINRGKAIYPSSTTTYYHTNQLRSSTLITSANGWPLWQATYLPYGEEYNPEIGDDHYKFTGKERDAETGLDNFGSRYYGSTLGRFLTPDPVVITPERIQDPQQLNRYAYVRNNPLRFVDPTGETLWASGDIDQDRATLCSIAGLSDCRRIGINEQTGSVSFNTQGLDLSQNEGAALLNQLVTSSSAYGFALSDTAQTAGGPVKLKGDNAISNLDDRADDRYSKGKTSKDLPSKGINDQVTINPQTATFKDSQGRTVSLSSLSFHELAEAYAKIDGGKPYGDFTTINVINGTTLQVGPNIQQGAHNEAVQRELQLREQRPNLKNEG